MYTVSCPSIFPIRKVTHGRKDGVVEGRRGGVAVAPRDYIYIHPLLHPLVKLNYTELDELSGQIDLHPIDGRPVSPISQVRSSGLVCQPVKAMRVRNQQVDEWLVDRVWLVDRFEDQHLRVHQCMLREG